LNKYATQDSNGNSILTNRGVRAALAETDAEYNKHAARYRALIQWIKQNIMGEK